MTSFYICAIFVVLTLSAVKADVESEKEKARKACMIEVPVAEEELKKYFEDPANINDAIKCHLKCTMEKRGVLKDGLFDVQAFLKTMETYPAFKNRYDDIIRAADECKTESGINDCDTAANIFKCLGQHKANIFGSR